MRFKLILAHTLDPSVPFWIAHPTKKYLHPKAQPAEISVEKMHILGPAGPTSAFLVEKFFGSQIRSEAVEHLRMAPEKLVEISAFCDPRGCSMPL